MFIAHDILNLLDHLLGFRFLHIENYIQAIEQQKTETFSSVSIKMESFPLYSFFLF